MEAPPEGALPPELAGVTAMSDEDFAAVGEQLRECARGKDFQGFQGVMASALWDQATAKARLGPVAKVLFELLEEHSTSREAEEMQEGHLESGTAIVNGLFRLALSPDLDEVRVQRASDTSAPVVVLFGFAGSCLDELRHQTNFYHSWGLTVITLSLCAYPFQLRQRQNVVVAREIRAALTPSNRKLLLHVCSGHGCAYLNNVLTMWYDDEAPFDGLPPAEQSVAAVVFECCSPLWDGSQLREKEAAELQQLPTYDIETDIANGDGNIFISAANNCIQTLGEQAGVSWWSMISRSRFLNFCLRRNKGNYTMYATRPGNLGAHLHLWGGCNCFFLLDKKLQEHSISMPRLYLYSEGDKLWTAEMVEAALDIVWQANKRAKTLTEKCKTSPHMKLWDAAEKKACVKAVTALLKAAKIPQRK